MIEDTTATTGDGEDDASEAVVWNHGYQAGYRDGRIAAIRVIVEETFFPDNGINAALKDLIAQIEARR